MYLRCRGAAEERQHLAVQRQQLARLATERRLKKKKQSMATRSDVVAEQTAKKALEVEEERKR